VDECANNAAFSVKGAEDDLLRCCYLQKKQIKSTQNDAVGLA
jgi:hypothetical protein